LKAVPWLRRLVAGHRPEFDPWSVHVKFVVDKVARDRFFSEYFCFPHVNIILQMLLIFISTLLYQKDKRAKPGNLPESNALSEIGENWIEKYFHFVFEGLNKHTKR
jgi:hypothetical protein